MNPERWQQIKNVLAEALEALGSDGSATLAVSNLPAGVVPLTAEYNGDSRYAKSTSSLGGRNDQTDVLDDNAHIIEKSLETRPISDVHCCRQN
jgi:hypothetical protein